MPVLDLDLAEAGRLEPLDVCLQRLYERGPLVIALRDKTATSDWSRGDSPAPDSDGITHRTSRRRQSQQ